MALTSQDLDQVSAQLQRELSATRTPITGTRAQFRNQLAAMDTRLEAALATMVSGSGLSESEVLDRLAAIVNKRRKS